jgi:phospholipase C
MTQDRRRFLQTAALAGAALPLNLRNALALPAHHRTGTIKDVEHVVILMQENRSFDHYFGTLRGVRGFGDPRPTILPTGKPVWFQPAPQNADGHIAPFHLDTAATRGQCLESLDHSWKRSQDLWKNHDAWIGVKGPMTMGHFTRDDIPFYHALADAFTICDAYHCSIFGPTNPNRLFLFSGTSGLAVGNDGLQVIMNPHEETNETADPAFDSPHFAPFTWPTYAERLQAAGVGWRVYQEYDNYGDNGLAYFARFRGHHARGAMGKRARRWAKGSNAANARSSRGEHLIAEFAADVAHDRLPQVSWIVAPYIMCEHPTASPGYGEAFVSGLLSALAASPAVWSKTVFILNYDENDGFFDHVPPPVPPIAPGRGKSTVDVAAEIYKGEPVGLGPRVPLIVVSPWTRGGWVNSQLADHTSVIRFLEARFGVLEPQISPWRRAVCGDLTSMFDFSAAGAGAMPAAADTIAKTDASCTLQHPKVPAVQAVPVQEKGGRSARPLPYDIHVAGEVAAQSFRLTFRNDGAAGAALTVYAADSGLGPWYYTIEAGKTLTDELPLDSGRYAFTVHGPNGYLREFGGSSAMLEADARYDAGDMVLRLFNRGTEPVTVVTAQNDYQSEPSRTHQIAPGDAVETRWRIASNAYWYDLTVKLPADADYLRRFAGHAETGMASLSDPAFGRG